MEQRERAPNLIMLTSKTIKKQLTKAPNTIEHWGVSEWLTLSETTLALRVNARYLDGMVCITWYVHTKLYGIEFFNNESQHKYQIISGDRQVIFVLKLILFSQCRSC